MSNNPQPPRGFYDLFGDSVSKFQIIEKEVEELAKIYGFEEIRTPIVEFSSVFERSIGQETDVVSKEMYSFADRNGEGLTLRPENTASVVRAFLSNGLQQYIPLKLFYVGPMFRYERPQKGRQRQFHQFGFEIIGEASYLADVELISIAVNFFNKMNIKYRLSINTIGDLESRKIYLAALVDFLKKYETDLSADSKTRLHKNPLRVLDSKDDKDIEILKSAPSVLDYLNSASKEFFERTCEGLDNIGISYSIDNKLVRGLDYYNHTVFEFISDEIGAKSTILGGGRYDGLIAQMGGKPTPAVGFAAGIERISLLVNSIEPAIPSIAIVPLQETDILKSQNISNKLRSMGIAVDFSYHNNLSKHLKVANKKKTPLVLFVGKDSLEIKDMNSGKQDTCTLDEVLARLI